MMHSWLWLAVALAIAAPNVVLGQEVRPPAYVPSMPFPDDYPAAACTVPQPDSTFQVVVLDSGRASVAIPRRFSPRPPRLDHGVWSQRWETADSGAGPAIDIQVGPRAFSRGAESVGGHGRAEIWQTIWPVFRDAAHPDWPPRSADARNPVRRIECADCLVIKDVCRTAIGGQRVPIATGQFEGWGDDRAGLGVWDLGRERRLVIMIIGRSEADRDALLPVLWTVRAR